MTAQRGAARRGHGARPAAQREAVLDALLSGLDVYGAAEQTGVPSRTIRQWLSEDGEEGFGTELGRALAEIRDRVVEQTVAARVVGLRALALAAKRGDVQAAAVLVKLGEPLRLEHSGPGGKPIETRRVDAVDALNDEQLEAKARELLERKT